MEDLALYLKEIAENLVKNDKNYRKVTKYIDNNKIEMFSYILSDYANFKKNNSFFMRGFAIINDTKISFGLEKFFNVNENEDWRLSGDEDLSNATIVEKFDGTLIIPFLIGDKLYFRTKMDVNNEFTKLAESCITEEQKEWCINMLQSNVYPLFELVSPFNRIVVNYEKTELKPICCYDFVGNSKINWQDALTIYNSNAVKFKNLNKINSYLDKMDNFEGFIIDYKNKVYKIKSKDYVLKHKSMSSTTNYKNLFDLIIKEKVDDIKNLLSAEVLNFVEKFEKIIIDKLSKVYCVIENADRTLERKDFVEKYKSHLNSFEFAVLMKYYDGRIEDLDAFLKDKLKNCLNTETKVKEYFEIN